MEFNIETELDSGARLSVCVNAGSLLIAVRFWASY